LQKYQSLRIFSLFSLVFSLLLIFSFVFIDPTPTQASIEGELCSIWWVDTHVNGWPHVDTTTVDSCPISCFGDVAGDIHTGVTWCSEAIPPPNYAGIDLGNACSANNWRTINLMTDGTLGDNFEIQGNGQVVNATNYTFTNIPEGLFTVHTQSHNAGGSSGWSPPFTAQHDYSAPITTPNFVGLAGDNGWFTSPIDVSFDVNDVGCFGVSQTVYDVNGILENYNGLPFTITNEGINSLSYHSTDGYNAESSQSTTIQIDTMPPTLQFILNRPPDVGSWWNAPLDIAIFAEDTASGLANVEYNLNGLEWISGTSLTLTDGIHSLDAQASDNAGHSTYDGVVIQIDSIAPILDVSLAGDYGENSWFITPPTVSLGADDATSGVLAILYQVDNGAQALYTSSLNFIREGLYTLQAFAVDNAQHITSQSFQVGYDITPPQTTATLTEIDGDMTVTLTGWDAVSGVKTIRMAINGVWADYHHPVVISEIGDYWVQYFSIDVAGHIESEKITQFTIADTIQIVQAPPVVTILPPANPPNTPPFETVDDFPPNLHDENIYFHSPPVKPPNTPPFETADDFPPNLHDENIYFHTSPIDRTDEGIKRNPRIILDEELPFVQAVPQPNVVYAHSPNIIDTLTQLNIPQSTTTLTSSQPAASTQSTAPTNGVLATLATLGAITAGAIVMTASAMAIKNTQQTQKAQALATLQAQQISQTSLAGANWAQNQSKQASAHQSVISQVTQSQANINHQNAFMTWQKSVFVAMLLALTVSLGYSPDKGCESSVNSDTNPSYEPCGGGHGAGSANGGGGTPPPQGGTNSSTQNLTTSFNGRQGFELRNGIAGNLSRNSGTNIYGYNFSAHSVDQMQNRGIPPSVVADTIKNGVRYQNNRGVTVSYSSYNRIVVYQNPTTGNIITVRYGVPTGFDLDGQ
jgi:hypothetical protein